MSVEDLLKKLIGMNIHPRHYTIGQEIKDYATNIELLANGKYAVYYLERGEKVGLKKFATEEEALTELIQNLEFEIKLGSDLTK